MKIPEPITTIFFALLMQALLPFSINAQNIQSFSLGQAQDFALKHNTQTRNAELDKRIAERKIHELRSTGLPQINAEANLQRYLSIPVSLIPAEFFGGQPGEFAEIQFGTNYNASGSITLTQLIFDGSYFVGLQAAKTYRELMVNQSRVSHRDVKQDVARAYYTVLLVEENLGALEGNYSQLQRQLFETEQMLQAGFIESLDRDRVKLSLSAMESQMANMKRQHEISILVLKYQMNYPMQDSLILTDKLESFITSTEEIISTALDISGRPEFKLINTYEELARLNVRQHQVKYLPSINAFATHQQVAQRNEFTIFQTEKDWFPTTVIGVSLRLPIFDSFHKHAVIQQAKLELEQIRNEKENLGQALILEYQTALRNFSGQLEQMQLQRENMQLAGSIFERTRIKYREGVGSSLEMNTAQSEYYQAQSTYFNTLFELLLAKTELEKALGLN